MLLETLFLNKFAISGAMLLGLLYPALRFVWPNRHNRIVSRLMATPGMLVFLVVVFVCTIFIKIGVTLPPSGAPVQARDLALVTLAILALGLLSLGGEGLAYRFSRLPRQPKQLSFRF